MMGYSRKHLALILRQAGFPEAAEEALRVLPDLVEVEQLEAFLRPYGITRDEVINRMGGSP